MRDYNIDSDLEAGAFPKLSLQCYSVTWESGNKRKLTRYTEGDILADYIDIDSIHAEWAYDPNDIFQPGGVIPTSLSFRLFPGHGLSHNTILKTTLNPKSASDYSYVFRPCLTFNSTNTYPFPYMLLKEKTLVRGNHGAYKLYFEDENCMFEYAEFDIGSHIGESWRNIVYEIVHQVGLGGTDSSGIAGTLNITGTSYYDGDSMSARKVMSYIAQMNGVFVIRRNDTFTILPMLDAQETSSGNYPYVFDAEIPYKYVMSTYNEKYDPAIFTWSLVDIYPYNTHSNRVNNPDEYSFNNNPFLVSENRSTYQTILSERVHKKLYRSGVEVVCRFNPNYEVGDYLKLSERYLSNGASIVSNSPISVARIVWNGSAFCTIYGARFGVDNR